ncbi:MAG: LamG domain-containing protein [Dehalococcoidia bacterium]|nr:LamG domain-containing protein [Dehalococcoidia bacterium]
MSVKRPRGSMFLGPGIVLGVAALLAVVVAQLPEGSGARAQPASDAFAYATATPTPPFTNIQSTVDATAEAGGSLGGGIASTVQLVYRGSRAESAPSADRNDRAFGVQPRVIFEATGESADDLGGCVDLGTQRRMAADVPEDIPDYGGTVRSKVDCTSTMGAATTPPFLGRLVLGYYANGAYAQAEDETELDVGDEPGESLTIEGWFYDPAQLRRAAIVIKDKAYELYAERYLSGSHIVGCIGLALAPPSGELWGFEHCAWPPYSKGWHHVAGVFYKDTGQMRIYLDGTAFSDLTNFGTAINNSAKPLEVGFRFDGGLGGEVDELRISDFARYAGPTYAVPTAPFTCDEHTHALWHFDESEGATVFHDACGVVDNLLVGYNGAHTEGVPEDDTPPISSVAVGTDAYAFGRDAGGSYWYRHWNGTSWEAWSGLGGVLSTSPSAVAAGADVYVFGLDAGGGLWYRRRSGGTWGDWQGLGGVVSGQVSGAATASNDLYVFGRDAGGSYWNRHWNGTIWEDWSNLGGILSSSPSAVAAGADIYVSGLDAGGGLWYQRLSGGTWGDWQPLSGVLSGQVSGAATADDDVYVFGGDAGGSYWNRHWNGTSWEAWSGLGGVLSTSPSAVAAGADVYVFGLDAGGGLWYQRRSGGTWGGWQGLGGVVSGQVSAAATADNNVYVFGRDAGGSYWYRHWNGTSWQDWSGLGGILAP